MFTPYNVRNICHLSACKHLSRNLQLFLMIFKLNLSCFFSFIVISVIRMLCDVPHTVININNVICVIFVI